ncbi:hypothetical protein LIER_01338 [Lithospermum erythrorhizon]|uniref:Gag-pol polyprotein n=1 Tax=Lithospermum erythrorhizon TaxID=34254 RepID=A0AAV3NLR5_LITER
MESANVKVIDQESNLEKEDTNEEGGTTVSDSRTEHAVTSESIAVNDTSPEPAARIQKDHPVDIIGQLNGGITTRRKERVDNRRMSGLFAETCFISKIEPANVSEALKDEHWINAMQEELLQFHRNDVWELVPRPESHNIVGNLMNMEMLRETKQAW